MLAGGALSSIISGERISASTTHMMLANLLRSSSVFVPECECDARWPSLAGVRSPIVPQLNVGDRMIEDPGV